MISFNILSNNSLTIKVKNTINSEELHRIYLLVDSVLDENPYYQVLFDIDSKLKDFDLNMIQKFFKKQPYDYTINYIIN